MGFAYLCKLAIGEVFEQGGLAHGAISDQDVSKLVVEDWLDHRCCCFYSGTRGLNLLSVQAISGDDFCDLSADHFLATCRFRFRTVTHTQIVHSHSVGTAGTCFSVTQISLSILSGTQLPPQSGGTCFFFSSSVKITDRRPPWTKTIALM